ncbi:MAG: hypothetical protein ACLRRT_04800 [Ruthenibacterium lactatiformans]
MGARWASSSTSAGGASASTSGSIAALNGAPPASGGTKLTYSACAGAVKAR